MNFGMPEMIFILLLALVVVGPRRLPELARQLGKYVAEFKRASNEFKQQLETEMLNIELEERAKKSQEEPKLPAAEVPAEDRTMHPVAETIGRPRSQLLSKLNQRNGDAGSSQEIDATSEPVESAAAIATSSDPTASTTSTQEEQCPVP